MPINDPIVSARFVGIDAEGARKDIVVELGRPYLYRPNEWACPLGVDGVREKLHEIHGGDALQSLCLALRCVYWELDLFQKEGGKLEFEGGDSVPLESYFSYRPLE